MKVVVVGGVAGGASCAARLRRLDENAEIIMVERGPYVSYANCGLPYHVGGVIEKEESLGLPRFSGQVSTAVDSSWYSLPSFQRFQKLPLLAAE